MNSYKKMVVIFVDLLGTKNNVKFEDKYYIHRLFHGEAKINEQRNLEHVIYNRKIYSFSDCAYFFYYYKENIEEERKNDMKLLQIAMANTANSLLRILNSGYLLRGGIAFGDAYLDDLGFFGPAIEEAYRLEASFADIPIIALSSELGERFCKWEDSETNMEMVELMMTSRPTLVEQESGKYFLNMFYQLEAFNSSLSLEDENLNIYNIKEKLFEVISRDKEKYRNMKRSETTDVKRSSVYEKISWMEEYLKTKHNRMRMDIFEGGFSGIFGN